VNVDYPFRFDARGRTAATDDDDHIRDMIEQLLFTNPGERVNRPDFGSGVLDLVFAPNSPELAAALQFSMQAAVQQWLGDLIQVDSLEVLSEDATLRIELRYVVRRTGDTVPAASLAGRLAFTRRWPRAHWRLAFQGNLHEIGRRDFGVIERALAS